MKKSALTFIFIIILLFSLDSVLSSRSYLLEGNTTVFQMGIYSPLQLFDDSCSVYGMSWNLLYGENQKVYGINLGPWNTVQEMGGAQFALLCNSVPKVMNGFQFAVLGTYADQVNGIQTAGFLNLTERMNGIEIAGLGNFGRQFNGFQFGGWFNYTNGATNGIQVSAACNVARDLNGIQVAGLFNWVEAERSNWVQLSMINCISNRNSPENKSQSGVQLGFLNIAEQMSGVQIGVINYARRICGVQIGVANFIAEGGIPFLPLFNASLSF